VCACFMLCLITLPMLTSILAIFKRKEFDNYRLFRYLFLILTIAEKPTSRMYKDKNGNIISIASTERIGHIY